MLGPTPRPAAGLAPTPGAPIPNPGVTPTPGAPTPGVMARIAGRHTQPTGSPGEVQYKAAAGAAWAGAAAAPATTAPKQITAMEVNSAEKRGIRERQTTSPSCLRIARPLLANRQLY